MSSVFGSGGTEQFDLNQSTAIAETTYIPNATNTTEAIVGLDNVITLIPSVNQPYEDIRQAIDNVADVAALGAGIDAPTVKNLYESNFDTNAFTNAYKDTLDNIGTYVDASELATALTPYRTSADQDVIDLTFYLNSNPDNFQTDTQVSSSISSALIPYRSSAAEDVINATKLATADLISDIIPHPVSGGGPAVYEGTVCCGAIENGMHNIGGTLIPQFPTLDIYDFTSNGVVNFKGSNYYSFNFGTSSCAYVKETAGSYAVVLPSVIFGANPGNFVYKFVTNGTILVAISKQSSTKFFWTTDGLTWNDYDIGFNEPLRSLDIIDGVVFVGANFAYRITDVNNPSFTSKTIGNNVSKFFKYLGDVYYMCQSGIFDYNSQTYFAGSPGGATQGDVTMSNVIVDGSSLYVITALDNDVWKFNGSSWSVIDTTDFDQTHAIHKAPSGTIYLGGYTTDESRYGTLIADTFTSVPTGDGSNRQDSGNWYIYGFGDVYSGGGGAAGISVLLDAGANVSANVFDTLVDLATANDEIRATVDGLTGVSETFVNDAISTSQSTQDSSIASTYKTISSFNSDISAYLTTASASSTYQPISGMTSYLTTGDAASTYKTIGSFNSDISAYLTTANAASTYLTSANAASTYYLQTNPDGYQTAANVSSSLSGYLLSATAASTYATLIQFSYLLRPKIRIVASSGGSLTPSPGQAYSTIASALAAAVAGDCVFVCPGTYNESGLTIPADVELRGFSRFSTFLSATPTTTTTVITIGGANAKITDMTIRSTSTTNGANQTLVALGSTYNTTFYMRNCELQVNGVIGDTDTADAICIDSTATGSHANDSIFNWTDCTFIVDANGLGVKRAFRATGANSDHHFDGCQFSCIRGTAGADYIAFEVNASGADSQLTNCYVNGFNQDISATTGIIQLGKSTVLHNSTTNGKSILVYGGDQSYVCCNEGTISAGASYASFGGNYTGNERRLYLPRKCVAYGLTYSNRLNTSTTATTITLLKNGVDTALTLSMTAASLYGTNTTNGITFAAGDYVSIRIDRGTGTITDTNISFSTY